MTDHSALAIQRPTGDALVRRIWSSPLDRFEFREPNAMNDQSPWYTVSGHAAVFDQTTTLYKARDFQITEDIAPDAFQNVLARSHDVVFNMNHDSNFVLARTGVDGVGGLELGVDRVGLRMRSRYSQNLSYGQDLAELMRSGVVDQMSFAFTIAREDRQTTTDEDGFETNHFRILEVGDLYDVCVACGGGAYPQTDAVLHARIGATGRNVQSLGLPYRDTDPDQPGGTETSSRSEPFQSAGDENAANTRRLTLLRLKAAQQLPLKAKEC